MSSCYICFKAASQFLQLHKFCRIMANNSLLFCRDLVLGYLCKDLANLYISRCFLAMQNAKILARSTMLTYLSYQGVSSFDSLGYRLSKDIKISQ